MTVKKSLTRATLQNIPEDGILPLNLDPFGMSMRQQNAISL
jgi:hypothetical protein